MTKKNNLTSYSSIISIIILAIISLSYSSLALPPLPTEFYGRARSFNQNASVGTTITAYDSSGNLCGTFTIVNQGFYGILTCNGDDPESTPDDGAVLSENISFRLNGQFTTIAGDSSYSYGAYKLVNITYPVVFCGDSFCDVEYESNITCGIDCPSFNTTGNTTSNTTGGGSSSSGGGGSGSGSGGSGSGAGAGSGSGGSSSPSFNDPSALDNGLAGSECDESWSCKNWTICSPYGIQNRSCIDRNSCGTSEEKPPETQQCTYTPTCADGIKNGLEEEIDCGGLCKPCIGCKDGLQNCHSDMCEEAIDCGGPCSPCPTCFDGIKNCQNGICEDAIDCGGPCSKSCPQVQKPAPILVCQKEINPFNNQFIIFFAIVFLSIIGLTAHSEMQIYKLKSNPKAKGIERARKIYSLRRREILYSTIILLISILLYLYYYIFVMCSSGQSNLPIILATLLLVPAIIYATIKYLEYDEKKKIARMDYILNYHDKQIKNLLSMENEGIIELLKSGRTKLRTIIDVEQLDSEVTSLIRNIITQVNLVIDNYSSQIINAQTNLDESKLSELIKEFAANINVIKENEKLPSLKNAITDLQESVKQIEEKKALFNTQQTSQP